MIYSDSDRDQAHLLIQRYHGLLLITAGTVSFL